MEKTGSVQQSSDFSARALSFLIPILGLLICAIRFGTGKRGGDACFGYAFLGFIFYTVVAFSYYANQPR